MRKKLIIMIAGIFLILGISFFMFDIQNSSLTGFSGYKETSGNMTPQGDNQTVITKEIALQAINESETIIKEMKSNNFSVNSMEDSLIEAKRVFQQAEYASILRGEVNATEKEKEEANQFLRLIKWQNITYESVLFYTEDIKKRKETAFLLLDKISVEENNLKQNEAELKSIGLFSSPAAGISNETQNILEQAKIAFSEERYDDAEKLLEDFNVALEKEKSEASILAGIKTGAKNFFQRYWIYIIIFLIIISVAGYFTYKKYGKKILTNKIRKIKTEEKGLNDLIKKVQTERFKENKISASVYKITMEKYQKRAQEIKQELPVLEEKLKKFKKTEDLKTKKSLY
jgi:hypothetical protein